MANYLNRIAALEAKAKIKNRAKLDIIRVIVAHDRRVVSAFHRSANGTLLPVSDEELLDIRRKAEADQAARRDAPSRFS